METVEKLYLICAIVGGGIFFLRTILLLIGFGGDHDVGNVDSVDTTPAADFKMVSIHSLTAFFLMFGLVGYATLKSFPEYHLISIISIIAALVVGFIVMLIIAKIFQATKKLNSDGTIYAEDSIGATGTVYLTIKPGNIGKVQIVAKGALKIYDARAKDHTAMIKTGQQIKVVECADVLLVETVG